MILLILFLLFSICGSTQEINPFELIPRLDPTVQKEIEDTRENAFVRPSNPFDIAPPPKGFQTSRPSDEISYPPVQKISSPGDATKIILSILSLITLTLLVIAFRVYFERVYTAFLNDNLLGQLYRERVAGGVTPFWALYFIYFFNIAFFIFLLFKVYAVPAAKYSIQLFFAVFFTVVLLTTFKHLVLSFIAFVFPVEREAKLYSFSINIFNIIVGIALIPVNLLIASGPANTNKLFIALGFIIIILIYIFRSLRGLLIANRFITFYKFHFLLYICTIEFAPLVLFYKITLILL